jgi:hypothetical protein
MRSRNAAFLVHVGVIVAAMGVSALGARPRVALVLVAVAIAARLGQVAALPIGLGETETEWNSDLRIARERDALAAVLRTTPLLILPLDGTRGVVLRDAAPWACDPSGLVPLERALAEPRMPSAVGVGACVIDARVAGALAARVARLGWVRSSRCPSVSLDGFTCTSSAGGSRFTAYDCVARARSPAP